MKKFDYVVLCGEELVSLEIGDKIKILAVKLEPQKLKREVERLTASTKATKLVVTSAVAEMLNKDMKKKLTDLCSKNFQTVDSIDFTAI